MNFKMTFMILASFLFTQIACAMSEAGEILLETVEHNLLDQEGHDSFSKNHNEIAEHQDELTGVSHCMHSHPQLTLMFCEINIKFEPDDIEYGAPLTDLLISIYHKPPIAPPIS